ncbi:MAG: hypothetical protein LBK82_06045, partial [Planctomycetaceae bacterium]|nr:hypothetical protein [Planctomycetaceae bacterium]
MSKDLSKKLPEILAESSEIEKPEVTENKVPLLSKDKEADKFRKEFSQKIRRGTAVRKDYDVCKNGIEQLK